MLYLISRSAPLYMFSLLFLLFSLPSIIFSLTLFTFSLPPHTHNFLYLPVLPQLELALYSAVTYTLLGCINIISVSRAEDDSLFQEPTQSHHQWWFVNFSTVQIKYAQHSTEFDKWFNDVQTILAFFLSWESSDIYINHSHWIYWMLLLTPLSQSKCNCRGKNTSNWGRIG